MKRRLSVAMSTAGDPRIILLDEPTTGTDPVTRRQLWTVIERVGRGRAVLLTTHRYVTHRRFSVSRVSCSDFVSFFSCVHWLLGLSVASVAEWLVCSMDEADVLCSRIAIMSRGKLVCIGSQQVSVSLSLSVFV